MQTTLNDLGLGKRALVTEIEVDRELKTRLGDLGLVPGTQVCCRYRSPGGHVTALELRGAVIALRTRDMKKIRVRADG